MLVVKETDFYIKLKVAAVMFNKYFYATVKLKYFLFKSTHFFSVNLI